MLAWILTIVLLVWLFHKRLGRSEIVKEAPLGLPEGTVRAFLAIIVVSLPLTFIWLNIKIPIIVSNIVFLVTAFYFEKRSQRQTAKEVAKDIQQPIPETSRDVLPMYWHKYSVRILLVTMIIVLFIFSQFGPEQLIDARYTIVNLLIMIFSFVLGLAGKRVETSYTTRKIKKYAKKRNITPLEAAKDLELKLKKQSLQFESAFAVIVIFAVLMSLFMFTFNLDIPIIIPGVVPISVTENLLQLLSVYFGFRQ
jgi:small-conductance mechanosensitive channel